MSPFNHRRHLHLGVAIVAAAALVAATALPASAHAEFASAPSFGNLPNTSGGTGELGSTPPYAANTTPTMSLIVPFEQTVKFNGSDDTTVDVKVFPPAGWTNPTCGAARTLVNNSSTKNTDQPGAVVAGWTCQLLNVAGQTVLHWTGPQVKAPKTATNSAQFFVFKVTTPSPAVHTTYDGSGGNPGFIVDQVYASGHTQHWIPNAAFPGTAPPGSTTEVSDELARTVGAGPTCKAAAGSLSFSPTLPKLGSTQKVKTTIRATGPLSGCTGAGVTSGHTIFVSKPTAGSNCSTVLTYNAKTPATAGTETITWDTGQTSTLKLTLQQVKGKTQQLLTTGTVIAGLFKGSVQSGTLAFTLPANACHTTGLSAASYKQATNVAVR